MEGEGGWINGNSIHFIKLTALPDTPPSPPTFNFTVVTSTGDSVHLQSQSPGGTAGVTRGTDEQRWGGGVWGGRGGGEAATDLLLWDEGVPGFSSGDCFPTLLPYGNRRRRSGGGGGGGGVISKGWGS